MTSIPPRALDANNDGQPDYTTEIITMRTALEAIPRPIRLAAYLLYAIGGPVMIYLHSKQLVGPEEISLWLGIGTVFGITAAGNVQVGAS